MNNKLFVGNLSYETTENDLQELFESVGPVNQASLILDKMSGRSRGFAFVTMSTAEGAESAVQSLDGKQLNGRSLKVSEAREREPREGGFERGGGGGGRPRNGGGDRREFQRRKW